MMMVMGTLALPMTLSAPAGPWMQAAALALAVLAWLGVVLVVWASDWPSGTAIFKHIAALTVGLFSAFAGVLGVCYCVGVGLSILMN